VGYSSFEDSKLIFENWRQFTQEPILTEADDISEEEAISLAGELLDDETFLKIVSSQGKGEEPKDLNEVAIPNLGIAAIPIVFQDIEDTLQNVKDNKLLQQESPEIALKAAKLQRWFALQRAKMTVGIDKLTERIPLMPKFIKKMLAWIIKKLTGSKLVQRAGSAAGPVSLAISVTTLAIKWLSWMAWHGAEILYFAFTKADPKKYVEFMNGLREIDVEAYNGIEEKYPTATAVKYLEEMQKEYKKKGEKFPPEEPDDEPTDPTTGQPKKSKTKLPSDMFSYVGKR
jgi:murein DD-endopeptidase MepM/ murein hydrolase activator NlpD